MSFTGTLHPYQREAFDLMVERQRVLVAYDMGLGKTVLTIAAIEQLMDNGGISEPGLVVCLSSLKYQWAEAITKFTGGSSTPLVVDGTPARRSEQYAQAKDWLRSGVDYVILNYEQVVNDWAQVRELPRGFVVIDEATAIKSFRSKRSKMVKKLDGPVRFALTGTPVENGKPEELFSLMQFVDQDVLGRFDDFDRRYMVRNGFGGIERYRNLPDLNARVRTGMVRKRQTDPDVAPFLPTVLPADPADRKVAVPLDTAGARLYGVIAGDLLADLSEARELFGGSFSVEAHYGLVKTTPQMDDVRGRVMAKTQALRMLCDSPELLRASARTAKYANGLEERGLLKGINRAPKLSALGEFVANRLDEDPFSKAVIFTTYRDMVGLIRAELKRYGSEPYTGGMNAKEKEAAKKRFQTRDDVRLLVSTDAGGYGVDLPQANLLLNYGVPWSSGTALQRDSRIIRASSEHKHVHLRDFIIRHSVEERQWQALQAKSAVASAVVDGTGINADGGVDLTVDTLTSFLSGRVI